MAITDHIYICLLRGINVSGQKLIKMEELKRMFESLGFTNVLTYIQSGNIIFQSSQTDISELTNSIKKEINRLFGFDVSTLLKTKNESTQIVKNNPFKGKDISKLHVTFLHKKPEKIPYTEIEKVKNKSEEFLINNKEIYLFCPNGYGKTKLTNTYFEKKLKVPATTRNWKTTNKLDELIKPGVSKKI